MSAFATSPARWASLRLTARHEVVPFEAIGAPGGFVFIDLPKTPRFICLACGAREAQGDAGLARYRAQRKRRCRPVAPLSVRRGQLTQRRGDLHFQRGLEIAGEKNEQALEDCFIRGSLRSVFLCCGYARFGGTNASLAPAGRF
jgi:hypothetical protein